MLFRPYQRLRRLHYLLVRLWIVVISLSVSFGTSQDCLPCECTPVVTGSDMLTMDCSNRGLDKIPDFLSINQSSNVTTLYLNNNNITVIEEGAFDGLPKLRSLYLSHNNMSAIGYRVFYQMKLTALDLSSNLLTNDSFNETTFEDMESINLDMSRNLLSQPPRACARANLFNHFIIHHNPFKLLKTDAFVGFPIHIRYIDISDCQLEYIEPRVFDASNFFELRALYLDNNNLTVLKPSFFESASVKEILSIQNSNVQKIEKETFTPLKFVQDLFLNNNNIGNPQVRKSFKGLTVHNLFLRECNITRLKENFLDVNVHETLDLSFNNIPILFESGFGGLKNVRNLLLSNCNLTEIRGKPFKTLRSLQKLYLDFNQLSDTSNNFLGPHSSLRILDISQNQFTRLPNIAGCTALFDLYASSNKLKSIESGTFNMTNIKNLRLSSNFNLCHIDDDALMPLNNLTNLDLGFSSLKKLPLFHNNSKLLDISIESSRIEELPSDLCKHTPKLSLIFLRNNGLTAIPDLQNCSELSKLFFDFNRIKKIGENSFSGLGQLLALYLHNNEINEIHPKAFFGLERLEYLHLTHNNISYLPPKLLDGLIALDTLQIEHNYITNLPNKIFKDLLKLRILYLNDNSISDVGDTIFHSNLTWLQKLNISNNPQLSKFPIPQNGFPFIHTFSMMNLPLLYNVPSISKIPRVQYIYLTYAYHCCVYRDHLPSELLITPKKVKTDTAQTSVEEPTGSDTIIHGNGTHADLTEDYKHETVFVINRPSEEPLVLPDFFVKSHLFPESQDPYNPKDHDISQEELNSVLLNFGTYENITVRILENNEIDLVGDDGFTVYGGMTQETLTKILNQLPVFNVLSQVSCNPKPNAFMPCENLLDPDPVRVLVWIVWFPAILGNIAVIFVTLASTEKVDVPSFILCNLALADFMLGIFLSFLGVVDVRTFGGGSFYKSALHWQKGPGCQTAGFIGVFSSELSVYIMVILTLERLQTIAYSFGQQGSRMKMRHAVILVGIGWLFAGIAALLPLLDINSYSEVSICLPFRTEYLRDKVFIGVLLSLTVVAFLTILFSYVHILIIYCKLPASERRMQERFATSVKMGILVFTNSICWLPLAVLGLASLADVYLINLTVAKYFIILILPLNSCLNPFLYTVSKKSFWQKFRSVFRRTDQRIKEVTSNTKYRRNSLADRRNSLASAASTTSSNQDTIDFDLLQKRRSRRSFSLQMETLPPIISPSQSASPVPYTGRRYSSPAIFEVDNRCRRLGTRLPSDPILMEQPETHFLSQSGGIRPQSELFSRTSNCLSVVHEETSMYGSDDDDDNTLDTQSPLRFSAKLKAVQKADRSLNSQRRHCVSDYIRREIHVLHEECDNRSDCSSGSEYDDARSSPLPQCSIKNSLQQFHNNEGNLVVDELNRYCSSTTDSHLVMSTDMNQNCLTRIDINPHTKKPVKGIVESSC